MQADTKKFTGEGSPAHAGIDPTRYYEPVEIKGFPRTRGDRQPLICTGHGSPAHAGIDPAKRGKAEPFRAGSPAHAGIDPGRSATTPARRGSPAHAGIDPRARGSGSP